MPTPSPDVIFEAEAVSKARSAPRVRVSTEDNPKSWALTTSYVSVSQGLVDLRVGETMQQDRLQGFTRDALAGCALELLQVLSRDAGLGSRAHPTE